MSFSRATDDSSTPHTVTELENVFARVSRLIDFLGYAAPLTGYGPEHPLHAARLIGKMEEWMGLLEEDIRVEKNSPGIDLFVKEQRFPGLIVSLADILKMWGVRNPT